jgi:hypothetical protein
VKKVIGETKMKRPTNWLTVAAGLSLLLVMLKPAPLAAAQQISSGNNSLDQFQVFTLVGGVTVAGVMPACGQARA